MDTPNPIVRVHQAGSEAAPSGRDPSTTPKTAPTAWPFRRIALWWLLLNLAYWYQEPMVLQVFRLGAGGGYTIPDFFQDWASAKNYREGLPIYTPQEVTAQRYLGISRDPDDLWFIEVNAHPPTSVLLAVGLSYLDFRDAFLAWNLLSLAAFAAALLLIALQLKLSFSGWEVLRGMTLLLICDPFWQQMLQGQLNLFLLLAITAAWAAARSGRPGLAGCLLGAATAIKLFPAFLFLYFALRRQWRAVAGGAITFVGLTLVTAAILGPDVYQAYYRDGLPQGALYRGAWHNMSLPALWAKLFDPGKRLPVVLIQPLTESPTLAVAGAAASVVVVVVLLAWLITRARSRADCDLAFGLSVVGVLVVSPVTWEHYCMLLPLPLLLLWQRVADFEPARLLFVAALFALWPSRYQVVSHIMILMGAENRPGDGWIATPWETLTALSVSCYALLGLFMLGVWAAVSKRLPQQVAASVRPGQHPAAGFHKPIA